MTELLIAPARETGCEDLESLAEVIDQATQRQRSPLDDILDSGVVDEEPYMRNLAGQLGIEWLDEIPEEENLNTLREACGPRVALKHRLLPVALEGEEGSERLVIVTFDPFNLAN